MKQKWFLFLLKLVPQHTSFFCVTKWEVTVKYFCLILKQCWLSQGKALVKWFKLATFFMQHHLSLIELLTHYGYSTFEYLADIFSNEIVFVADDKIHAFKWKLEFWKTCVCLHELDSFPVLRESPDEAHGDVNRHDIFSYFVLRCVNIWRTV